MDTVSHWLAAFLLTCSGDISCETQCVTLPVCHSACTVPEMPTLHVIWPTSATLEARRVQKASRSGYPAQESTRITGWTEGHGDQLARWSQTGILGVFTWTWVLWDWNWARSKMETSHLREKGEIPHATSLQLETSATPVGNVSSTSDRATRCQHVFLSLFPNATLDDPTQDTTRRQTEKKPSLKVRAEQLTTRRKHNRTNTNYCPRDRLAYSGEGGM